MEVRNFEREEGGKVRNRQMFFGGLPLSNERATMVVERNPIMDSHAGRPKQAKKFSTDAFLDLYLNEKNKQLATFQEVEQQMSRERET